MSRENLVIGLVGVCGSGKTTLTNGLKPRGFNVRQIAQEHSYVPDMWKRLTNPDVLIFLEASYPTTKQRKTFKWKEKEYQEQLHRLRDAYEHADLHITTDELTPDEVMETVMAFLEGITGEEHQDLFDRPD
jgi:deoxyadenosine/deoxycytidine kinase